MNIKTHPVNPFNIDSMPHFTANGFWFLTCSTYFPRHPRQTFNETFAEVRNLPKKPIKDVLSPFLNEILRLYQRGELNEPEKPATIEEVTNESKRKRGSRDPTNFQCRTRPKVFREKISKVNYTHGEDIFLALLKAYVLNNFGGGQQNEVSSTERWNVAKRVSLNRMLEDLEETRKKVNEEIEGGLKNLSKCMDIELNKELFFQGTYKQDELLRDIQARFKDELSYLDYMEFKQQNTVDYDIINQMKRKDRLMINAIERPKKSEDYVCQVCNDGDYMDNNQIVFCGRCNISVHQRCYGLKEIPEGTWVCDLCKYHGPNGRFMKCALCTRRGGCLTTVNIQSNSEYWKTRNPSYYEFNKSAFDGMSSEIALYKDGEALIDDNVSVNSKNFEDFLFYDYYKELEGMRPEQESLTPKTQISWVHLSCAIWLPEIKMLDLKPPLRVDGMERIEKARFNLECRLCGKKEGSCVQCPFRNCQEAFHVECARRSKMFMEARNSENKWFTIYCERHAPLMTKRLLDSYNDSKINEISKFCRYIEKFYESYKYKFDDHPKEEQTPAWMRQNKKKKVEKVDVVSKFQAKLHKNKFIKEVNYFLNQYSDWANVVTIKVNKDGEPVEASYTEPKKKFLKSMLPKSHGVWTDVFNVHGWKHKNTFKKYHRLLSGANESPLEGLVKEKVQRRRFGEGNGRNLDQVEGVYFIENRESTSDLIF
jgi:hypothetical protein